VNLKDVGIALLAIALVLTAISTTMYFNLPKYTIKYYNISIDGEGIALVYMLKNKLYIINEGGIVTEVELPTTVVMDVSATPIPCLAALAVVLTIGGIALLIIWYDKKATFP